MASQEHKYLSWESLRLITPVLLAVVLYYITQTNEKIKKGNEISLDTLQQFIEFRAYSKSKLIALENNQNKLADIVYRVDREQERRRPFVRHIERSLIRDSPRIER